MTQKSLSNKSERGNSRSRSYCFTFNNYATNDISNLLYDFINADLYCFQEEIGKSGTPHLQGVVKWKNQRSFSSMRKINRKIHWEHCKFLKESVLYCSKDDTRSGEIWKYNVSKYLPFTHQDFLNDLKKTRILWNERIRIKKLFSML